jgi:hypothetical protein
LSFSRHHRSLPAPVEVCRVEAFGCRVIILAVATPPVQLIDYPGSCQTSVAGTFYDCALVEWLGLTRSQWTVSQYDSECISRLHPSRVAWATSRDPVVPPATKSGRRDFTTAAGVGRLELKALGTTSRRGSGHIFRLCPGRTARAIILVAADQHNLDVSVGSCQSSG